MASSIFSSNTISSITMLYSFHAFCSSPSFRYISPSSFLAVIFDGSASITLDTYCNASAKDSWATRSCAHFKESTASSGESSTTFFAYSKDCFESPVFSNTELSPSKASLLLGWSSSAFLKYPFALLMSSLSSYNLAMCRYSFAASM